MKLNSVTEETSVFWGGDVAFFQRAFFLLAFTLKLFLYKMIFNNPEFCFILTYSEILFFLTFILFEGFFSHHFIFGNIITFLLCLLTSNTLI